MFSENFNRLILSLLVFLSGLPLLAGVDSLVFNLSGKSDEYVVVPVKGKGFCLFYNGGKEWEITVFDSAMKEIKKAGTGISSGMPMLVHDQFESRINILFGKRGFSLKKKAKPKAAQFRTDQEVELLTLDYKDLRMIKTRVVLPFAMTFRDFKSLKDHSIIAGERSPNILAEILQLGTHFATFGITYMAGVRYTTNRTNAYIITHELGDVKEVSLEEPGHEMIYSLDKNILDNTFIINQITKYKRNKYHFYVKTVDLQGKIISTWVKKNSSRKKVGSLPYSTVIFPSEDTSYRIGIYSIPFKDERPYSNLSFKKEFESGGFFIQPIIGNQRTRPVYINFKRFQNITQLPPPPADDIMYTPDMVDNYVKNGAIFFTDLTKPNFLIEGVRIDKEHQYIFSGQVYYPQFRQTTRTDKNGALVTYISWHQWSVKKGFILTIDKEFKLVHDTSFMLKTALQRKPESVIQTLMYGDSSGVQVRCVNPGGKVELLGYTPGKLNSIMQLDVVISENADIAPITENRLLIFESTEGKDEKRTFVVKMLDF